VLGPQLAGGAEVGARALLVKGPQGQKYLLWSGRRLRLPSGTSEAALGYTGTEAIEVAPALLNAIPAGHDLAVTIRDVGAASPRNKARRVGQLFRVERAGGGTDYYVMLAGGLSRLTDVGYSLVRAAPDVTRVFGSQPPVTAISPGDVGVTVPSELAGLPATPPELAELTGDDPAVCAERGADAGANPSAVIRLFGAAPALLDGARPAPEKVLVPGGRGALVRTPGKALFLVTDDGRRFGLPSAEATSALGYADVTPLDVPAELIALIPQGPALDPAAARLPVAR
jgi:hypothetical protein